MLPVPLAAGHHVSEDRPLLQGPLNAGSPCLDSRRAQGQSRSPIATALHTTCKLDFSGHKRADEDAAPTKGHPGLHLDLSAQACTSAVVVGFSDGKLYAHVSHGLLGPCWSRDGSALQSVDSKGKWGGSMHDGCVRLEESFLARQPASLSLLVLTNEFWNSGLSGSTRAVRYECGVVPLPAVEGSITCGALMLLDLIDLELPTAGYAVGLDEDEDDDDGLGVVHGTGRLSLLGCEDCPESMWAVHSSGCWSLSLPWLPTLSKALAESCHRVDGSGSSSNALGHRKYLDAALSSVPPPVLREIFRASTTPVGASLPPMGTAGTTSSAFVSAASPMHDMFLGDSLVVALQPTVSSSSAKTTFHCFMQRQEALAAIPSREAPPGVGTTSSDPDSGSTTAGSPTGGRKAVVDANLNAVYADLCTCKSPNFPKSECAAGFNCTMHQGGSDLVIPSLPPPRSGHCT